MAVVTIARLIGAGGDSIAARVAEKLGYTLIDSALELEEASTINTDTVRALSKPDRRQGERRKGGRRKTDIPSA